MIEEQPKNSVGMLDPEQSQRFLAAQGDLRTLLHAAALAALPAAERRRIAGAFGGHRSTATVEKKNHKRMRRKMGRAARKINRP